MLNCYPTHTLPRDANVRMDWKSFKDLETAVEEEESGFAKTQYIKAQQGEYTIRLPKTIFTAVAALPTICIPPEEKNYGSILCTGPLFIMSVFTVMAQLISIWYVFGITVETKDASEEAGFNQCEAPDSSYLLRLTCLCVFVASVLVDLKESAAMVEYVCHIPTMNKSDLNEKDKEILNFCRTSLLAKKVKAKCRNYFNMEEICCGGITTIERMWFWFWIFLKIAPESLVIFVGARYVLYADSNENLILNSVALLFITQIDDIAYTFAVTDTFKIDLNGVPDIGKVLNCDIKEYEMGVSRVLYEILAPWFFIGVLLGTSAVVYTVNC